MAEDKAKSMTLSSSNILLLTEMFCLPYEHGESGNKLLTDFEWLLENVCDIYEQPPSKEKVHAHWKRFSLFSFNLQSWNEFLIQI